MAPPEEFTKMSKNLIIFIEWLASEDVFEEGKKMVKTMRRVAPKLADAAGDSSGFGMAKSLFMGASDEGVDLTDQGQLDAFVQRFNNLPPDERAARFDGPPRQEAKVVGLDPFRHLGRNDRIDVRDMATGEVQLGVKFKFVEAGLRGGGLELV